MKKLISAVLVLSIFAFAACTKKTASADGNEPYTIEIGGSTSVSPLMEMLADEYSKEKPYIKININGTGSGDGINNAGKLYQLGMSSRDLTAVEQGSGIQETVIAIDGIAVIMNTGSPITNLTVEQIKDIYTGAINDWSQVSNGTKSGRIAVISRESGSGTRSAFEELVGFPGGLLAGATESTSTGAIKAGIVQNPNAIGYISLGSLDDTIKAISINGFEPSTANVVSGNYKIARPFIILNGNNLHPESKVFIDWILGQTGQDVVKRNWISVK